MKKISILGSTGSIGTQSINILSKYSEFKIVGISGNKNIALLLEQAKNLRPDYVVIYDEEKYSQHKADFKPFVKHVLCGMDGLLTLVDIEVDLVINAVVGNIGLLPTLKALKAKKNVAIANKECLVTAGDILMKEADKQGVKILPIDSEHSAIFQALQGNQLKDIKRVILTASGGPFRDLDKDSIIHKKANEALKHPNWTMGRKISIDSATLMNKGLEVIEAKWLYDLEIKQLDVIVHRESIIHSMVEYVDHSILAQMSYPSMELPILYAVTYPSRLATDFEPVNFETLSKLSFEPVRRDDFPCLDLAYEAIKRGGLTPTVLNAANEILVEHYLNDSIKFYDIPKYIEKAINHFEVKKYHSIDDILLADQETRKWLESILRR